MSDLVTRLRAEVDEDVNEPLDRLLDEAAGRVEALEMTLVEMLAKCSWAKREQWCRGVSRSSRIAFHVPDLRHGRGGQARNGHQTGSTERSNKRLN
jgi:hypothetical protein